MKELKFRAWSLERKSYVDVWEITFDSEGLPGVLSFEYDGLLCKEPVHNFIVEQCIGLKDKNGKEIFEGDLVAYEKNNIASVRFEYGGFYPFVEPYNDFGCPSGGEVEIIGNIHESNMEEE